jgi:hypothetical protein
VAGVTSDEPVRRLSGEQVRALKFAAHRQLSRWAKKSQLSEHQQGQRLALKDAVRVLAGEAFAHGCELRPCVVEADGDG